MKPLRRSSRGLTLVELMVAIAIALVLSLGLVVLLANTSRGFIVQDESARLYDAGALAIRTLADDIRMTGFYGTGSSNGSINFSEVGELAIADDCGEPLATRPWALNADIPIEVREGLTATGAASAFPCIRVANFLTGSPVIVLRGAFGPRVPDRNGNGNYADDIVGGLLYVQSAPNKETIIFRGQDFATLKSTGKTLTYANGDDAPIFEFQTHVYYLRPCSRPTPPSTECNAMADGGQPVPTLVRHQLVGPAMQVVPLAEGIEALAMRFGIDADNDGIADRFEAAQALAGQFDWERVVAVRITLLARSAQPLPGHDDRAKRYDLDGIDWNCADRGAPCNHSRHVFSQVVNLRNRNLARPAGQ